MSKVFIEESTLTAIGDAIREKTSKTDKIPPLDMPQEIKDIQTGGIVEAIEITHNGTYNAPDGIDGYNPITVNVAQDDGVPTNEELTVTGNCIYKFGYGTWNWLIEKYKDRITSKDITSAERMWSGNISLTEIPFKLNFANQQGISLNYAFYGTYLRKSPLLNIPCAQKLNMSCFLQSSSYVRDWNGLFENEEEFGASWQSYVNTNVYGGHYVGNLFNSNNSLRTIPTWFYLLKLNPESTSYPSTTYCIYHRLFNQCYSLDEIKNIPVWKCKGAATGNIFVYCFNDTYRVKDITFETNADGSPIVTEWKSQIIDLSSSTGWGVYKYNLTDYNSGITADKEVKDATTYATLKNDADWFTVDVAYSRYNHDSAVNTINSLPDTSAYLTANGGTNTIKFKGNAGALTDGGAINTLTAEEIAVATAKGWTVSLV